jgi:multiple sugar transport system permease protein
MDVESVQPALVGDELLLEGEGASTRGSTGIPGRERGDRIRRAIAYAVMFLVAALFAIPFLWSVSTSFRTLADTVAGFSLLPRHWTTSGYHEAFHTFNFGQYTLNSAIIAGAITLSNLFLASLGGYAFARLKFPGREVLFMLVLGTLMIPDQLRFVPVYLIERQLGLITRSPVNYIGVVLILAVEAQQLFLMRQYFLSMPRDLEEAAKIDGAGHVTTFLRVMLPLAGPALAAVSILAFQGAWNGFFWPLLILQSQDHWTLPLGLFSFRSEFRTDWPALMSVTVAAILPILCMYVFFQKYFVQSVASSGVKG